MVEISKQRHYDVLVIGGGATGTGIALDAATRGLKVALVEKDDFGAGTSSRSSKLIHGGVRYLEKAFLNFDMSQFELVSDALRERKHLLHIAPHLSRPLPIIVPLYHSFPSILFFAPYYWIGIKMYDLFAGSEGLLQPSYFISRREALEKFPMLKDRGLKCGIVYYDGQHDDARMNLGIALTAISEGAQALNHVQVLKLNRKEGDEHGPLIGARVQDTITGEEWDISADTVVNATGPFSDCIRKMDDPNQSNLICPSAGVHVTLSERYSPAGMGLIVPNTTDGRVLFLLPWEGSTIAGTTDSETDITHLPRPTEEEIQFILDETSDYLVSDVKREDVDAAWSGIRPLALSPSTSTQSTQAVSRDHVIEVNATSNLVTIAGGKWTTYRRMAEDVVDRVILERQIAGTGKCRTSGLQLIGAHGWSLALPTVLERRGFAPDVAEHLAHAFGDKAPLVADLAPKHGERLAPAYPYIQEEVVYAMRHEYAETLLDVLARRTRVAFLNSETALQILPRLLWCMALERGWSVRRRLKESADAVEFLRTMNRKKLSKLARGQILQHLAEATCLSSSDVTSLEAIFASSSSVPDIVTAVRKSSALSSLDSNSKTLLLDFISKRSQVDLLDLTIAIASLQQPKQQ